MIRKCISKCYDTYHHIFTITEVNKPFGTLSVIFKINVIYMTERIYIIEPVRDNVIHDCFTIVKNLLVKSNHTITIITDFVNHKKLYKRPSTDIESGSTVIIFAYFLRYLFKDTKHPIYEYIKKWNVVFVNTESFFVKRWKQKYDILNRVTNIRIHLDYTYKNTKVLTNSTVYADIFAPMYHKSFVLANKPTFTPTPESKQIGDNPPTDIDVLFYGNCQVPRRQKALSLLKESLPSKNILFICDYFNTMYYATNAKIVLVINRWAEDFPIDYYRIYQLVCNGIFVIHEKPQIEDIESTEYELLSDVMVFAEFDDIASECKKWLEKSQSDRKNITDDILTIYKTYFDMKKRFEKITESIDQLK